MTCGSRRRWAVLVTLWALGVAGCSPTTPAAAPPTLGPWPPAALPQLGWVEVPLAQAGGGLFAVEAEAHGQKLLLLLDGGAATLALDRPAAARLGLPLEPARFKAVGLGAAGVAARSVRLPSLQLGPFACGPVTALVLDLAPLNQSRARGGDRPVDGVVGADFLGAHQAVLDYPQHRLYLKPRDPDRQ